MTVRNPALFLQSEAHPAEDVRRWMHDSIARSGGGISQSGDLKVTQNGTPNMSVNVAEGCAYVVGTEGTYQGVYFVDNRGVTNVPIDAAHGTNGRFDLIVARIHDAEYSGLTSAASIEVVTGTPAASPTVPTPPANCIVLAQVAVSAAVTSITNDRITDRRTYVRGPWNTAWGRVASTTVAAADQTNIDSTIRDITGLAATFTAVAGRRYKVSVSAFIRQSSGSGTFYLSLSGGGLTNQRIYGARMYGGDTNNDRDTAVGWYEMTPTAGSVTLQVRAETSGGTGQILNSFFGSKILVEDIGPIDPA